MTLIPYSPIVTGRLWRDYFNDNASAVGTIRANVKEQKDAFVVEAEVPGVQKEDVTLVCEKSVLTISVKAKEAQQEEASRYVRKERPEGDLSRRFVLENIEEENISAKMENGVLYVTLPKKGAEEKRIEIE